MSEVNITKEAWKAEAKIRRIRANALAAVVKLTDKYDAAEKAYVADLPVQVVSVLIAAGVLPPMGEFSPVDAIFEGSVQNVPLSEVLTALGDMDVELYEEPAPATLS